MPRDAKGASFTRGTGVLVIEVRHSNPNGDPDAESEPRTLDGDGRGLISPVSFKRKLRDLVGQQDGLVLREAERALKLKANSGSRQYAILESRGRKRDEIFNLKADAFSDRFWDGRIFGNTFLEDIKDKDFKQGEKDHFISTGVVPATVSQIAAANARGNHEKTAGWIAFLAKAVLVFGTIILLVGWFVLPPLGALLYDDKTGNHGRDIGFLAWLLLLEPLFDLPRAVTSTAFQGTRRMRALAQVDFQELAALPPGFRKKATVTEHLPKGVLGHRRRKRSVEALPLAA